MSLLWFAPSLFRMLERTLTPKFAIPFLMKGTLWWEPVITCVSFETMTLQKAKHVGWFSFTEGLLSCRGPSFQGIPSWRPGRSRTLIFSFEFSLLLCIVFHSTLLSSKALTCCCPLYAIFTVSLSFALKTCPWRQQRQWRASQMVVFHWMRNASRDLSVPCIRPATFFSLAQSRDSPF